MSPFVSELDKIEQNVLLMYKFLKFYLQIDRLFVNY